MSNNPFSDKSISTSVLKDIFGRIGDNVRLSSSLYIPDPSRIFIGNNVCIHSFSSLICSKGASIYIGDYSMIGSNVFVYASSDVRIGKDCALGSGVKIYTEVQDFSSSQRFGKRHFQDEYRAISSSSIDIEDNCGVGSGCILLPGATLRQGSTLGAGTLWKKELAPYTLAYTDRSIAYIQKPIH